MSIDSDFAMPVFVFCESLWRIILIAAMGSFFDFILGHRCSPVVWISHVLARSVGRVAL